LIPTRHVTVVENVCGNANHLACNTLRSQLRRLVFLKIDILGVGPTPQQSPRIRAVSYRMGFSFYRKEQLVGYVRDLHSGVRDDNSCEDM
jgi:hypothetical protein